MTCSTARALLEGWRPAVFKGCEFPAYEVHFDGRVRNATTGLVLKPQPCRVRNGEARYVKVALGRDPVTHKHRQAPVHQLVCETWKGAQPLGMPQVVDHLDNQGRRNCATNLQWASYSMNTRQWYAWQGRLQAYGEAAGEHLHHALSSDEHADFARALDAPGW